MKLLTKLRSLEFLLALGAGAQTTVYVSAGGPASQTIVNVGNSTPIVVTTNAAHNYATTCGSSVTCYCTVWGVATGTGVSPANGVFQCHYVNSTQLSLYDKAANTPIAGTGNYFNGQANRPNSQTSAAWIAPVTPYTLGPEPRGYFDGPTGTLMRRVALNTQDGLANTGSCPGDGVCVSGGSGGSCASTACTVAVTTTYNPITGQGVNGVAIGNKFSITDSNTALDTCGSGGGAQSPYTMASVSSTGWTASVTCSGLTAGDYTATSLHCGPAATPNDTIGGTNSCTTVSQMAWTGNSWWTNLKTAQTNFNGSDLTQSTYKTTFDGGSVYPANALMDGYAMAVDRFLVDPAPASAGGNGTFWLSEIIYALNYVQRVSGVNFTWNSGADADTSNYFQATYDWEGLSLLYSAAAPYWAASEKAIFLNKLYNDKDDPTQTIYSGGGSQCNTANVDEASTTGHNWVLATGLVQTGTNNSTHVTLASSAHCIPGTVVMLANGNGYTSNSFGEVTSCSGATATVGGWVNGQLGTGTPPGLNNLVSVNYNGGLTAASGSTGQACWLAAPGNYFQTYVTLNGTNSLPASASNLPIVAGLTYSSAPTTMNPITGFALSPATCTGTASVTTTLGTAYTVFDAFTQGTTTSGATTIATFTSSSLAGTINVGDAVFGWDGWPGDVGMQAVQSYVAAVGPGSSACGTLTAKQLCVINGSSLWPTAATTPVMAWRIPQWTTYDCGFNWAWKAYGVGSVGATNAVYPNGGGGDGGESGANQIIIEGGNLGAGDEFSFAVMDLSAANDDSRAVRDLARMQAYSFHYQWRHYMDYSGGFFHSGASYSDITQGTMNLDNWAMAQSIPTFPNLDLAGPWTQNKAIKDMFATYPDQYGAQQIAMLTWGGAEALYGLAPNEVPVVSFPFDGSFLWAPQSNTAGYLRNWMENSTPYYSLWGQTLNQRNALAFLAVDPRVADVTYSNQPTQYYFNTSSSATCASTTGWPCHQFRGDMMISRGPWLAGGSPNLSASLLHAEFQTFTNDYDVPCPGSMRFYKAGPLLDPDSNNLGMVSGDCSVTADIPQFGGAQSDYYDEFLSGLENNETSVGKVEIAYAGGQGLSGSFSSQYGDSQSRFAYVSGNLAPAYNQSNLGISVSYANRSILDSKAPGGDQFEFRLDDIYVSPSTPTKVATHTHYPQTGQSLNTPNGVTIPTGSTVCVNSSYTAVACSGLNSNRLIEEKEDGGEYSGHQPARVYGLMSWWTSPGTITLNWDIPGTFNISNTPPQPQASPSNTYTDGSVTGNGYSNRVTEACGSSVGASFSGECTILEVHKVMQSLSDSTFTRTAFNPSSTWTGAQVCGAISCAVGMFGIGNATQTTIPHFTTTHAGTAQYLVAGLTPGPYSVKVNGSAVSGSPFTVPANDTSLMFESTAGTVSVSAGASPSPTVSSTISGQATVHGNIIVH